MSNNDPIKGTGGGRFQRARRAFNRAWWSKPALGAAVLVVVGALIVSVLAIVGSFQQQGQPPAPVPAPTGSSSPAPSASIEPVDGSCDAVEDSSTSLTPEVPSDLTWAAVNGETWPTSPSYGPTAQENGLGVCFSNSPMGAALAATSMQMAILAGVDGQEILDTYVAEGPGKDLVEARGYSPQANDGSYQLSGFRIASFVDDRAEVQLVFAVNGAPTGFVGISHNMAWTGDDWKAVFSDSGEAAPLTNPSEGEFTPWRAGNE